MIVFLTLYNTYHRVIVVFQSRSISFQEQEKKRKSTLFFGFYLGLASAMGFPESCVLFFRGRHRFCHVLINAIHCSDPRNGVVLNSYGTETSILYRSSCQQTFMFKTGQILIFLRIHPLIRVSCSLRGIVCSRPECCICCPSSVS